MAAEERKARSSGEDFRRRALQDAFLAGDVEGILHALLPDISQIRRLPADRRPAGSEHLFELLADRKDWWDVFPDVTWADLPLIVAMIPQRKQIIVSIPSLLERNPQAASAKARRSGWTLLHLAATVWMEGPEGEALQKTAEQLIQCGADVNARTAGQAGVSPLHCAAIVGNLALAALLLDRGADINARDGRGFTPLHAAVGGGQMDVIRLLLDRGACVLAASQTGLAVLHRAAGVGLLEAMKLLLDRGADPNVRAQDGQTPLHAAAGNGQTDAMALLLDSGADINSRTDKGHTPLHTAAGYGQVQAVKLLVERDADCRARTVPGGNTPLHTAAGYGQAQALELLLAHGAEANAQSASGHTPLHLAVFRDQLEAVRVLLAHGADPAIKGSDGKTPLAYAEQQGLKKISKLLRKQTAKA